MTTTVHKEYSELFGGEVTVITIDVGNIVVCDLCNKDFTDSDESGGFLFGGKAVGPCCSEKFLATVKECREEHHIVADCPKDRSFANWVREDLR